MRRRGADHVPDAWPRGMRMDVAAAYVGLSASGFASEVKAGRAPKAIHLTEGRIVWYREDLDAYLDRLKGDSAGFADPEQVLAELDEWVP